MKKLKQCKAFTMIELLMVMVILGLLVLVIPNLDLFYLNAVKKEGVQLVRAIIEQERVYKADNGYYYIADDNDKKKAIQNWKAIKALLVDNEYFKADVEVDGSIGYGNSGSGDNDDKFNQVIQSIESDNNKVCSNENCRLEVTVKASPQSRAKGWLIQGHLIEGQKVMNNKNKKVTNKIVFKEKNSDDLTSEWQEISL